MKPFSRCAGPCLLLALALAASAARAADKVWTNGGGDGKFGTAANWALADGSATTVPGTTDRAIFTSSSTYAFASTSDCTTVFSTFTGGILISGDYPGTLVQGSSSSLTVTGQDFTIAAGSAGAFAGSNASVHIGGSLNINGGTYLKSSGFTQVDGDFNLNGGVFDGNAGYLQIAGSLSIAGGSFKSTSGTLFLGGDLALTAGTFDSNGGTVDLITSKSPQPNQSTLTGVYAFKNLKCTSPSKTLVFPSGVTQTISGTLDLNGGATATRIIIRSSNPGNTFTIDPASVGTAMFLDINDAVNAAPDPINPVGSLDGGNTVNWFAVTVLYVRADGGGDDGNSGADFDHALATIQAAIGKLSLNSASPSRILAEFRLAQSTGADDSYAPASYVGSMRRSFDLTVTGGLDVDTDTPAGRSRIVGTGTETGLELYQSLLDHGMRKILTVTDLDIRNVMTGIRLGCMVAMDNIQPSITVSNSNISAGADGVLLDYKKPFNSHGPSVVILNNVKVRAGQIASGSAVQNDGPTPQVTISNSLLTSKSAYGLHVDWYAGNNDFAGGGTFVTITDSEISNCGQDGIHYQNTLGPVGQAHWFGNSLIVTLDTVKTLNNGGHGAYLRTIADSVSGRGGHIDLSAVNCVSCNNGGDGIHLQGDYYNTDRTSRIDLDVANCTLAGNAGDGLHAETSYSSVNALDPEQIQELHNTILAGNGGDGFESIDADDASTTLGESDNDFFGNAGSDLVFQSGTPALDGSDLSADPLFSTLYADPYRPRPASTLLDAGSGLFAPDTDILGTARPQGAADAMGAYETGVPSFSATASAAPASGSETTGAQWNLSVTTSGGVPIPPAGVDPDYTFAWTLPSFPWNPVDVSVSFNDNTLESPTVTVSGPKNAAITVLVTVTDDDGTTATDTVEIIFLATPLTAQPTIKHAATSQSGTSVVVVESETVDLFGAASSGGGSYTYAWSEATQPFSSSDQDTSDTPGSASANPADVTYTLTVTDTYGLSASANVTATLVDPVTPVPHSTPAFIDLSVSTSSALSVTATGGGPDVAGTYATAEWTDITGGVPIASGAFTDTPTFTPTVAPGLNTVQVTVTDNLGFTGTATLNIYVVESGMTVTAEGTYSVPEPSFTGSSLAIFAGDFVDLSGTVTGGTGDYLFAWNGPSAYTSAVEDPGTVTPPVAPGLYTYTLTVTDATSGQETSADVEITIVDLFASQGLTVGNGKLKYKATTASTLEKPKDMAKVWVEGLALDPGDRLAFDFNGLALGEIAGGDSILIDEMGKGEGTLGPAGGPNRFAKVKVAYNAKHTRLQATCAKGDFDPFNQGDPIASAVTGLSPIVNVTVFVDRATADGVVDDTIVLPLMFKVRAKLSPSNVFTESGKKIAP